MSSPLRFAAAYCSAAIILSACSIKKAEVSPARDDDSAYLEEPAPMALYEQHEQPTSAEPAKQEIAIKGRPVKSAEKHDLDATVAPISKRKEGKDALMDRLYPEQTFAKAAAPTSSVTGKKPVMGSNHIQPGSLTLSPSEMGRVAGLAQGAAGYNAPAPAAHSREMKSNHLNKQEVYRGYADEEVDARVDCYRCPPPNVQPSTANSTNSEEYAAIYENAFLDSRANPLSTFSIDVDGASYSNTRRFIQEGRLPPADAVRLEEFINYFDYNYPQPTGSDPFSITTEVATTPWNPETKLVHIGLQGRRMDAEKLPPNNLVFLIDVSGSMASPDKLPLLKHSFNMLIDQLRPQDRISIVVYAGAAGMVLSPTSGSEKETIREALGRLEAGGSTAGGAGLLLAYQAAKQSFIKGGSNRVILASDGDFNVGVSSDEELVRLIEEKRKTGVFLSVLGFGTGNLKDSKMEQIADKGNGNYFYIDNINEGRKVLVEKMTGTLYAIAKDVKLQIEFNPALVKSYRLVGYENRILAAEDFNDDRKDAGELGAGTNVTALYEIVPAAPARPKVDPLKYQNGGASRWNWKLGMSEGSSDGELLTVKFRYKQPAGATSKLLSRTLRNRDAAWQDASENFRFSASAAGFGLLLRGSQYSGNLDLDKVAAMARGARGRDIAGHRAEFINLVESAKAMYAPRQVGYRQYAE